MKLSFPITLAVAAAIVKAMPAELEDRATPSNAQVTFVNLPDLNKSFKCGKNTYTGQEIYASAQRGVALQEIKETRGKAKYPHSFNNDDSKGNKLSFPSGCPADLDRMEFPLKKQVYDGGKSNTNTGDERVVYFYEPGEIDESGLAKATYCGIMTHSGAPVGGFLMC